MAETREVRIVVALLASSLLLWCTAQVSGQHTRPAKVMLGDVELHYIEQGHGDPVILLHGGQADYRAWPSLIQTLASRYRVISYSRRHHWPNANPLVRNHSALVDADDLARFIAALELGPVHLVGTSYGAFTALAFALEHPERVRSMVLAEPPVHPWITGTAHGARLYEERVGTVHKPAAKAFAAGDDEAAMRMFIDTFDGPGTFEALPAEGRSVIMANARFFKALTSSANPFPNLPKDAVRRLPMPIMIVRGERTDELHAMITEELARLLPAAKRLIVPEAGHGSPRQNPAVFNAAVVEFLATALRQRQVAEQRHHRSR